MSRILIVSHRGKTPDAAENALSSLVPAAAQGADLIEIDVRLSLDRQPFALHDAMLGCATNGRGWVRLWPAFALNRLSLRNAEPPERVPPLATMLDSLPEGIEPALHLKDRAALKSVLGLIRDRDMAGRTWLWLEHATDVFHTTRALPELRVTLLRPEGWKPAQRAGYFTEAQWVGAAGISVPASVVDRALTMHAHRHHLRVFTRLDNPADATALALAGINGIITDDPAAVRDCLAHFSPEERA